jgi:hypothetical protein
MLSPSSALKTETVAFLCMFPGKVGMFLQVHTAFLPRRPTSTLYRYIFVVLIIRLMMSVGIVPSRPFEYCVNTLSNTARKSVNQCFQISQAGFVPTDRFHRDSHHLLPPLLPVNHPPYLIRRLIRSAIETVFELCKTVLFDFIHRLNYKITTAFIIK